MTQELFNPADYFWEWTSDNWYKWNSAAAHDAALKARNLRAKQLTDQGKKVKKFRLGGQLISRGGIGTPYPHIEVIVTSYGINWM